MLKPLTPEKYFASVALVPADDASFGATLISPEPDEYIPPAVFAGEAGKSAANLPQISKPNATFHFVPTAG